MKRPLSVILILAMIVSLFAGLAITANAAETLIYTLTPANGSNISYASNCDVAISGITWNVTGNSQMLPWRIGGKSLTAVDRTVYSKTAMSSAISKVDLVVGAASSITVNSLNLVVASDSDFTTVIDTVSGTFAANSTITFTPTSGTAWATGAYYKFVFNVTVSGTSNKYVEFTSAAFYYEDSSPACTHENTTLTGAVAASCTTDGYTGDVICDDCGATVTAGTVIPATGHNYVDGVCTVCGAVEGVQLPGWYLVDDYTSLEDGVYAIISNNNYAFNGTISSGHGQKTADAFSFDASGYAASAPEGTLELTFTSTANGFTLYNETFGYFYATKASSGGLAWHDSEDSGWSFSADGGLYAANSAHLRSYNDTFRTYAGNSNNPIGLAHKVVNTCTHNWVAGATVLPTCTEDGYTPYTCSLCNETKVDDVVEATGHNYVDGVCTVCGAVEGAIVPGWYLVDDYTNLEDGVYAIISNNNYAFNGTITSGHGQHTEAAFSFDENGYATASPEGTLELTFTATANGFTLYNETFGYFYATKASSGGLAWHDSEDSGWSFSAEGGLYAANNAHLRTYNDTFRTYSNNSNNPIGLAHKVESTCEHVWVAGAAVLPTCTTDGYTPYTCSVCGATKEDDIVAATGHTFGAATDNNNGTHTQTCSVCLATVTTDCTMVVTEEGGNEFECSVCGHSVNLTQFTKTTTVANGSQIVIYHPTSGKALSATASGTKLAGVDVPSDYYSTTKLCIPEGAAVMTVADYNNGQFHLTIDDNGTTLYLTSGATGSSLSFATAPASGETDYGLWEIDTTTGLVLKNVNAAYNGNGQSLEFYNTFTTYGHNTTAAFQIELFTGNANCTHENTTLAGFVAATCTTDGYTGDEVCDDCGATVSYGSVLPATGHTYVEGVCTVCGAEEPATVYYQKVTTAPADWAGDYILVYEAGNDTAYVFTGVSSANTYAEAAITAAGIAFDETTMAHLTIATMTGGYSILVNGGTNDGKYIGGTSGYNMMNLSDSAILNIIAYNTTDSCVDITSNTSVLRWNNTSSMCLFRYYKSATYTAQQPVQLYKLVCNHDFSCTDNGNGTHTISCANCDYSVTEAHTFDEGVCTVCGAVDTSVIGLKIDTASLTLYQDIVVNFTASVPEGLTDPYTVVEMNEQSYTLQASREDAQGRLVFEFMNLTPDQMGDNIKATLYATAEGGQLVHFCKPEYSVKQYCTNVMAAYPDDQKLQTLLADMLVYGAATQRFTGHNADSLVTAGLDLSAASTFTNLTDTDQSTSETTDANIHWTGAGLECGSRMSMYFTLITAAGDATSVEVTINGRTTVYEYTDMMTDDPTVCRVVFRGISASEYGDVVTAVVKNSGTPVQTLTYSVNSYVRNKQEDTDVENLSQLVQAIYNYGASARSYAN